MQPAPASAVVQAASDLQMSGCASWQSDCALISAWHAADPALRAAQSCLHWLDRSRRLRDDNGARTKKTRSLVLFVDGCCSLTATLPPCHMSGGRVATKFLSRATTAIAVLARAD